MSFVGIISNIEEYKLIKSKFVNNGNIRKTELININKNNIENMKNIRFELMVVCNDLKELKRQKVLLNKLIENSKYLILNIDNNITDFDLENKNIQVITYGMNQKATVTASSIKDDEVLICLQRNIEKINGKKVEMQELKRKNNIDFNNIYNLLVVFILELLYN
ncbi:MAG: hypothetical protein IKF17_00740 [Clostridia bacterium]|nr:hypothetical protein [Clostridia bacterium]